MHHYYSPECCNVSGTFLYALAFCAILPLRESIHFNLCDVLCFSTQHFTYNIAVNRIVYMQCKLQYNTYTVLLLCLPIRIYSSVRNMKPYCRSTMKIASTCVQLGGVCDTPKWCQADVCTIQYISHFLLYLKHSHNNTCHRVVLSARVMLATHMHTACPNFIACCSIWIYRLQSVAVFIRCLYMITYESGTEVEKLCYTAWLKP